MTTVQMEWAQPDERSEGRDDPAWYTYADGHDLVVRVTKGDRQIGIYADGEMRIRVYRMESGNLEQQGVIRYFDQLGEYGIKNDTDLVDMTSLPWVDGYMDTYGPNPQGFYYGLDHNSWFDLYTDDEHLDCVHHSLTEAIEQAAKIVNDDLDELWANLEEEEV